MNFQQAEAQFKKLKARYAAGELSEAEFRAQLEDLMVEDAQGTWWMIGYETEQWYHHVGGEWVQAEPPKEPVHPEPPQPAPPRPAPPNPSPPGERKRMQTGLLSGGILGLLCLLGASLFLLFRVLTNLAPAVPDPTAARTLSSQVPAALDDLKGTPTRTPTLAPTRLPTKPATPAPTRTPAASRFFTEGFDSEAALANWVPWTVKNEANADDSGSMPFVQSGALVFDIAKHLRVYETYAPFDYDDVQLDVRVDNRGTNNNNVLLACRISNDGWYEAFISNNGLYKLYAVDLSRQYLVELVAGGSNQIRSGNATNDYSLICKGNILKLVINGTETKAYTENTYAFHSGQIAIGLASYDNSPTRVEFEQVTVSQP